MFIFFNIQLLNMTSYDKMSKKELFDICKSLNLKSYKSKTKSEMIDMIKKNNIKNIEVIEENLDSDEEISKDISKLTIQSIENVENVIIRESNETKINEKMNEKINDLYKLLHNANMRTLNMQFKYRAQFPIAVCNNLKELKQRINIYNV